MIMQNKWKVAKRKDESNFSHFNGKNCSTTEKLIFSKYSTKFYLKRKSFTRNWTELLSNTKGAYSPQLSEIIQEIWPSKKS